MFGKKISEFFDRNRENAYFVFRVAIALLFLQHGAQKLYGWFGGNQAELMSLIGLVGVIEFYGGIFIAFGLFTRYASFLAVCTMVAGWFMAHAPRGWIPIMNGGELALVYLVSFLAILFNGPGKWALDNKFFGKRY
jgi:putative oxidoreductase